MKNFNLNINGIVIVKYGDIVYKCSIQDISEEHFSINVPINNNEFLILDVGETICMEYYSENGGYYSFDTKIRRKEKCDNIPIYKLSLPFNITKIQRRDYVRVIMLKEVQYRKIDDDSWNEGTLLDLSGGGMRFKSKEVFKINERLFIKIETNSGEFQALAEIKRCEEIGICEYVYGLEFIDINEHERDKIIEEVFLVMRKQRQTI